MGMGGLCGALERSAHLFIGRENNVPHVSWCEREAGWGETEGRVSRARVSATHRGGVGGSVLRKGYYS
jgi:hypothetical protein